MKHTVGAGSDKHDRERKLANVLGFWKPPVHCEEGIAMALGLLEECSVSDPGPTKPADSYYSMAGKKGNQIVRKVLVKQDAHWPGPNLGLAQWQQALVPALPKETGEGIH